MKKTGMTLAHGKRQAKRIFSESEDDTRTGPARTKAKRDDRQNASKSQKPSSQASTKDPKNAQSSNIPERKSSRSTKTKTVALRPISAFFGPSSQASKEVVSKKAREVHDNANTKLAEPDEEAAEVEDGIEDTSDDGSIRPPQKKHGDGPIGLGRRNPDSGAVQSVPAPSKDKKTSGSQRFRINGIQDQTEVQLGRDQKPWTEQFAPLSLDELAVHKKKVQDVKDWLQNALHGNNCRKALVIKGPSGAGKSATVKLLAQSLGLELLEWRNPVGSNVSDEVYSSLSALFEDFLGRSHRFQGLDLDIQPQANHVYAPPPSDSPASTKPTVILIEEFPSLIGSSSFALQSFRNTVSQYLAVCSSHVGREAAGTRDHQAISPLILVITESRVGTGDSRSDNFTMNRLLGMDIISHPALSVIEFNPMAVTFIRKALDLIITKEARISGRRRVPGSGVLRQLCDVGDVRSAIGAFEFLCLKSNDEWTGRVAAAAKKGANTSEDMTASERGLLGLIMPRESNLGLFHSIGKIVYNKRVKAMESESTDKNPEDLQYIEDYVPEVALEQLMDGCEVDAETFVAALHENYVLSCEGPNFGENVDGCLAALSDGDLLGNSGRGRRGTRTFGAFSTHSDSLKQEEIVFQMVSRGILFALPYPVKRSSAPIDVPGSRKGKAIGHQMFYPNSMRLPRQIDEMEDLLETWQTRLQNLSDSALPSNDSNTKSNQPDEHSEDRNSSTPPRTQFHNSKDDIVLETLPCFRQIKAQDLDPNSIRQLEYMTQFHGIVSTTLDNDASESDEDGGGSSGRPPTTRITGPSSSQNRRPGNYGGKGLFSSSVRSGTSSSPLTANTTAAADADAEIKAQAEALYLQDDDIED